MIDYPQFTDQEILAKTIWGEARGEPDLGQQAIACVILNRVKSGKTWWGHDIRTVCLKPYQFSCWNEGDPNLPKLLQITEADQIYSDCMDIAEQALNGELPDCVDGATSYYAKSMPKPPEWAHGVPVAEIGNHLFFIT